MVRTARAVMALFVASLFVGASSAPKTAAVTPALKADLQTYLDKHSKDEHMSAVSLSVSLANGESIDVAAGTAAYDGGVAVTPANLFHIGSNTKAFTGVLALHLQSQGKLKISQTVGDWLPEYPAWKGASIAKMLHMISGIPTYDGDEWGRQYSEDPYRNFTPAQLIAFAYPGKRKQHVWIYSNTGYILTQLIEEKAGGQSYTEQLRDLIGSTGIKDIYYYPGIYPKELQARTVDGYFDNTGPGNETLQPMLKKNIRPFSTSWTQGAGGIIATPHALALWARDMYQGNVVTPVERAQLESLVSTKTADPIARVTPEDPRGFGLGVTEQYIPGLGAFWFYEGVTLGYRMLHAYFPKENVVIAVGLNSQPTKDHVGELIAAITSTLKKFHDFQSS